MESHATLSPGETPITLEHTSENPSPSLFKFTLPYKSIIRVEAWPLNPESDGDIYLDVNNPAVSETKYSWKANNHGRVKIEVDCNKHPKYVQDGTYYLAVYPYRQGVNSVMLRLTLIEAHPIQVL